MSDKQNGHPSEFIDLPDHKNVEIDKELIPLIQELNKLGLITKQCCQGGKLTLRGELETNYPAYITFDLGENIQVQIKPSGPNNRQQLTIYWKPVGENVMER